MERGIYSASMSTNPSLANGTKPKDRGCSTAQPQRIRTPGETELSNGALLIGPLPLGFLLSFDICHWTFPNPLQKQNRETSQPPGSLHNLTTSKPPPSAHIHMHAPAIRIMRPHPHRARPRPMPPTSAFPNPSPMPNPRSRNPQVTRPGRDRLHLNDRRRRRFSHDDFLPRLLNHPGGRWSRRRSLDHHRRRRRWLHHHRAVAISHLVDDAAGGQQRRHGH
jgi:hypothetical protein